MTDIDPITGLPRELGAWDSIAKENQKVSVYVEKKKFNKPYTIIEGIDQKDINIKDLAKRLKSDLACGGTAKDGKIELQGVHKGRVKEILLEMGFAPNTIDVR